MFHALPGATIFGQPYSAVSLARQNEWQGADIGTAARYTSVGSAGCSVERASGEPKGDRVTVFCDDGIPSAAARSRHNSASSSHLIVRSLTVAVQ
jgi:hypothetical protein